MFESNGAVIHRHNLFPDELLRINIDGTVDRIFKKTFDDGQCEDGVEKNIDYDGERYNSKCVFNNGFIKVKVNLSEDFHIVSNGDSETKTSKRTLPNGNVEEFENGSLLRIIYPDGYVEEFDNFEQY